MKKRVLILFGGKSPEHDVSISSAKCVLQEIDRSRFSTIPWYIHRNGYFATAKETRSILGELADCIPDDFLYDESILNPRHIQESIDIAFPVLHGPNGEDGTIQGLLQFLNIPYVGSRVLGSSLAMDKLVSKQIFAYKDLPILPYVSFQDHEWHTHKDRIIKDIEAQCTYPCFVKPANLGSSIGVSKVKEHKHLSEAINEAFQHDKTVLVEKGIQARELEIALLGNTEVKLSVIGEVETTREFYDYEAKYSSNTTQLIIPSHLPTSIETQIKTIATKAFKICNLSGFARIDFFLDKETHKLYLNEINTIPGFTKASMYPKLWQASNMSYSALTTELICLADSQYQ